MFGFFKKRRRKQLRPQPFPSAWRSILEEKFPIYRQDPIDFAPPLVPEV